MPVVDSIFLPAANEDTLCVFRLHVSCTFASIGNMRWFPLPLNQKHNVRDRDYLESNGSKQCETGGMLTNKHYESILFYPCILIIRHWEWGLLHLMSDIFPMPKGTPNKMQHKEDRIVCSSFSCPYLGWCSMLFQLFAAETTLIGQISSFS